MIEDKQGFSSVHKLKTNKHNARALNYASNRTLPFPTTLLPRVCADGHDFAQDLTQDCPLFVRIASIYWTLHNTCYGGMPRPARYCPKIGKVFGGAWGSLAILSSQKVCSEASKKNPNNDDCCPCVISVNGFCAPIAVAGELGALVESAFFPQTVAASGSSCNGGRLGEDSSASGV